MDPFVCIRATLEGYLDLCSKGFRVEDLSDAEFVRLRRDLFDEIGQVYRLIKMLAAAPQADAGRVNSYDLKDTLARWMSLREGRPEYICNGAVILACCHLCIPVEAVQPSSKGRTDPNALIGINPLWYDGARTVLNESILNTSFASW